MHAVGDVLATTDWNGLANNTVFLYQAPYSLIFNSVTTSLTNGVHAQITLGGLTASGYGFSVASNNAVVPLAGIYFCSFSVELSSSVGSGNNELIPAVKQNGTGAINGSVTATYANNPGAAGSGLLKCSAGDTLGLDAIQTSGSTMSTTTGASATFMHTFFVGSV